MDQEMESHFLQSTETKTNGNTVREMQENYVNLDGRFAAKLLISPESCEIKLINKNTVSNKNRKVIGNSLRTSFENEGEKIIKDTVKATSKQACPCMPKVKINTKEKTAATGTQKKDKLSIKICVESKESSENDNKCFLKEALKNCNMLANITNADELETLRCEEDFHRKIEKMKTNTDPDSEQLTVDTFSWEEIQKSEDETVEKIVQSKNSSLVHYKGIFLHGNGVHVIKITQMQTSDSIDGIAEDITEEILQMTLHFGTAIIKILATFALKKLRNLLYKKTNQ